MEEPLDISSAHVSPKGEKVLTDRGFKNIDDIRKLNWILVGYPIKNWILKGSP